MPAHVRLGWMQAFASAPTLKTVTAPPGRLGVMCIASELGEQRVGFTIVEVKPDSPLAGTVVVGDRILSVDGEELCHYQSVGEVMAHLSARASESRVLTLQPADAPVSCVKLSDGRFLLQPAGPARGSIIPAHLCKRTSGAWLAEAKASGKVCSSNAESPIGYQRRQTRCCAVAYWWIACSPSRHEIAHWDLHADRQGCTLCAIKKTEDKY